MNCEQVQSWLIAYLDGEVTPSERALIRAHLSGCTVCQQELDLLSTARSQVRAALQHRALQATPSREAWSRLEARLTEAAQPSSSAQRASLFSRKAPSARRISNKLFGGVTMQKRWIFSGLAGAIVLMVLAILVAQSVTTVSARQILDRAYEAQSVQNEGEGIQHTRIETYHNLCARPEGQGTMIITESYFDPQSGHFRIITTEANTGNVVEVFAFDGAQVYEGHRSLEVNSDQPEQGTGPGPKHIVCEQPWGDTNDILTVYRSAQSSVANANLRMNESVQTYEDLFQQMRNDPNAELLGEERWSDGRTVYVLRSRQPVKAIVEGSTELPMGWVVSYFDTESYKIVESRATIDKDGQELLVYSYRVLSDELLPVDSTVLWDLSDLQGIEIADASDGQQVSLLPEIISEEQLASQSESAYLLKNIPDGFTLEISASPRQAAEESFFYIATYRNEANDYFVIQSIGAKDVRLMEESSSESYTTNSGLIVTFAAKEYSGYSFTSAVVETPEGTAFILSSTLSIEQVKALAEDLVLVSQ